MIYVMRDVMHSKKKAHFITNVGYFNPNKLLKVGFWELKCEKKTREGDYGWFWFSYFSWLTYELFSRFSFKLIQVTIEIIWYFFWGMGGEDESHLRQKRFRVIMR